MFKFPKEKYRRLDQQPFSRVVLCYCTNAAPLTLITLQAMEGMLQGLCGVVLYRVPLFPGVVLHSALDLHLIPQESLC